MAQKGKMILLAVLVIAFAAFALNGFQFSLLGEAPSCTIPENGGECTLDLVLPQDRAFTSYNLNLQVDKLPSSTFGAYQPIAHVAKSNTLLEEDDRDDEKEYETVYAYLLTEDSENIYEIAVKAEATGAANSPSTGINADAQVQINGVRPDYDKYPSLVVCSYASSGDCRDRFGGDSWQNYAIKDYRKDGEDQYSIGLDRTPLALEGYTYRQSIHSDRVITGTEFSPKFLSVGAVINDNTGTMRNDAFLVITGYAFERGSTSSITAPANVQYAIKEYVSTVNFAYGLPNQPLDTKFGEFNGEMQTLDIASQLNEACERNDKNSGTCTIKLTFSAASGALVTVLEENEVLEISELRNQDPVVVDGSEPENTGGLGNITGGVVTSVGDFFKSNLGKGITLGLIAIAVIAAVLLVPKGGKKK